MKKWKDKIISAFSIFVVFMLALAAIVFFGSMYDEHKNNIIESTRFDNIKTEIIDENIQANTLNIAIYKEKETENIWMNIITNRSGEKIQTNLVKVTNIVETDIEFTYDVFSDCIIITHISTNDKYIYFKDSNTLTSYN